MKLLEKNSNVLYQNANSMHNSAKVQQYFMSPFADDLSKGLRMMILGLEHYCDGYLEDSGESISEDAYIGPHILQICESLRALLNGPGQFCGSTCYLTLQDIAEKHFPKIKE